VVHGRLMPDRERSFAAASKRTGPKPAITGSFFHQGYAQTLSCHRLMLTRWDSMLVVFVGKQVLLSGLCNFRCVNRLVPKSPVRQ